MSGRDWVPEGRSFSLCLTHDVDRPYKTHQSLYYAVMDCDIYQLRTLLSRANPYWQFDTVMDLEEDLGVRSAFYFLDEQRLFRDRPLREWVDPQSWKLFVGRYSIRDPDIVEVIRELDERGWEVGLHGSYESYADPRRIEREKATLEDVLGSEVVGGRQHYLNLDVPTTWRYQRDAGLRYDSSLGSGTEFGFLNGYGVRRPFDDEFAVFPLTIMENALPDPGERPEKAWAACKGVLDEAAENGAVMTVLWHPNKFNEKEYPNLRTIYRRMIEYAQELNAWIGPPGELYRRSAPRSGAAGGHPSH